MEQFLKVFTLPKQVTLKGEKILANLLDLDLDFLRVNLYFYKKNFFNVNFNFSCNIGM
jgi:hypothetical protein